MQHKAQQLGAWGGVISILITLVVLGPLAIGLYQSGKDSSFIALWACTSLAMGAAAIFGAQQTVRDPSLAALIQYLVGTFELLFFLPTALICLNSSAFIFFGFSAILAFASGKRALRADPSLANRANPFATGPRRNL